MKLLTELSQRLQQENQKKGKRELLSYAEVRKDGLSGKKFWQTYGGDGKNEVTYSGGQPLVFPVDGIQVGVRVELLSPEE